jgi:GNAT superfamily N-acetyltransferase
MASIRRAAECKGIGMEPGRVAGTTIELRPIEPGDDAFLRDVYASTRVDELAPLGWTGEQIDAFIGMQCEAQNVDYARNYDSARFRIIVADGVDAGRLYVERRADEFRVIDIALLAPFRRRGIGTRLFQDLFDEADAQGLAVRIHVEHVNPAQHLYLRLGFAFCGEPGVIYRLMERLPHARKVEQAA